MSRRLRRARALLAAAALIPPMLAAGQAPPPEPAPAAPPPAPPAVAPAPAKGPPPRSPRFITWVIEVGGDHGTKDLYTLVFTNETMKVGANTGLFAQFGASFLPLADGRFRTQATIGVKWTGQEASNGSVDYAAWPLEVIETVEIPPLRLGAGLYALLSPTLKGKGFFEPLTTTFEDSYGWTVRGEYRWFGFVGIGLRYVSNRLVAKGGGSIPAPAFGFVLTLNGPD